MSYPCKAELIYCQSSHPARQRLVIGRCAQALWELHHRGARGVTAAEISNWALRLGAYVHILRKEYGLEIVTLREPHDGGYHGRYVLKTPVVILKHNFD